MRAEEYRERQVEVEGWPVRLTSYRLGGEFHCKADNVSPGASLARTTALLREEAERLALARAATLLSRTQRHAAGPQGGAPEASTHTAPAAHTTR